VTTTRAIGPVGATARVLVGLGLFALAFLIDGDKITWRDLLLGLVAIPAVVLALQVVRLRGSLAPLRATGPIGHLLNGLVVAALMVPSATRPATLLWLGASMILAAWRGYAGCESLAISNWLLRRDDQVGCLIFWPIDELEARLTGRRIANLPR
jgi:hypothetical protein